jgi:hypothetical protein
MMRWRSVVVGAVTCGALLLAGCGGVQPGSGPGSGAASGSPAVSSPPAGAAALPSGTAAGPADIGLSSAPVSFTGDVVTLTVQAWQAPGDTQPVRVASATVDLGDGTTVSVSGPCAGGTLPPPGDGLVVRHVYRQPGTLSAGVTAATVCGQAAKPILLGSSWSLDVLPSAPATSGSWPQCSRSQVQITAKSIGGYTGHVGLLFTLQNTSSANCRLYGFPGLQLLGGNGQALPTTVVRAVDGSYLILKVAPHWVALPPGAIGSFDLEYGDNPFGAQASEPYAEACPSSASTEVTLPNAYDHSVVPVTMAPCGGQVLVSPVVPGAQWLH